MNRNIDLDFNPISVNFENTSITSPIELFVLSLEHERREYENIITAYSLASKNEDFATCGFLDAYVKEQNTSIKELDMMIKNIERCKTSEGIFIFDQMLLKYKR